MSILSHAELDERQYEKTEFLIDPYIPRQGIVFMWGDSSIGKSPVTWHMARSVASGDSFFGLPAAQGKVAYLEVDTPERVVVPRIQKLNSKFDDAWKQNLHWVFDEPLVVPAVATAKSRTTDVLLQVQEAIYPDLVIVNTCRKIHTFDDKDSKTPSAVYSYFKMAFPQAAILFVHHERKRSRDPDAHEVTAESFSGSKAWINDAQVGLHLVSHRPKHGKSNLRLLHHKSQVSEKVRALEMLLQDDGTNITSPAQEEFLGVWMRLQMKKPDEDARVLDAELARSLGTSERTIRRRRKMIEAGLWPKTREWLGRADRVPEEEETEE